METSPKKLWALIAKPCNSVQPTQERSITLALPVSPKLPVFRHPTHSIIKGLNIGADKEAAEHFLSALNLQHSTGNDTSDQLWFTLRRALLSMVGLPSFLRSPSLDTTTYRAEATSPNKQSLKRRRTLTSSGKEVSIFSFGQPETVACKA